MENPTSQFDGKQFAMQLATKDANRVGEALAALCQATRVIYTSSDGYKIEAQMIKELKTFGGLERIFELVVNEKGVLQDYSITALSGLTISNNDVGIATNQNRQVVQELLTKMKYYTKDSANVVLGLVQNMSFHYQTFRIRMAYENGVLERIVSVLESEVPKPIVDFDANNYIYSGFASPRFSLFTILSNVTMEKSLRPRILDIGVVGLCVEMLKKPIAPPSFPGDADNGEGAAVEIIAQLAEHQQTRELMQQRYGPLKNLIPSALANHPNQKTREWYQLACGYLGAHLHPCSNGSSGGCMRRESNDMRFVNCECQKTTYCSDQCQRSHWPVHSKDCTAFNQDLVESVRKIKEEGNVCFARQDFMGAIVCFTKALQVYTKPEENPIDYTTLLVNRAACYVKVRNFEQAILDCTTALEMSPQYMKALVWRGTAYQSLGHYKLALEDLCVAISLVDSSNTRKEIRDMQLFCCEKLLGTKIRVLPLNKEKKKGNGIDILHIPLDLDTLDSIVRIFRKSETPLRQKLSEARKCWEMGVQFAEKGDFHNASIHLGDALAIDERLLPIDMTMIHTCLQHVKQLGVETLLLSSFMAIQAGRIPDADSILTQSIESLGTPTDNRENLYLSRFFELRTVTRCLLGNKQGALEDLDHMSATNPQDFEHLYSKAKILQGKLDPNTLQISHFVQVEKLLVEFLSRSDIEEKRVPFALYNLSYLYCVKREMQKAREYFRKAVEAERSASVLWGSELDIENDLPRKMAFFLLKNDVDAKEQQMRSN